MTNNLSNTPSVSSKPEAADHNIIPTVDVAGHISSINDLTLPEPQAGRANFGLTDDLIIQEPPTVTRHPDYCTQNNGDCDTCTLSVDGVDCHGHINLLEVLEEVNP